MARRPCRRSEPSSSDAEEVSVFDRSGHGNSGQKNEAVHTVTRKQHYDDFLRLLSTSHGFTAALILVIQQSNSKRLNTQPS